MKYEVQPSRTTPDEWVVEAIDHDSEGEVYAALFSGHGAKERAEEYAAWKTWRDMVRTRMEDDWDEDDGPIIGERVVSEPSATMMVTELILTPESERSLTIAATSLGKVR